MRELLIIIIQAGMILFSLVVCFVGGFVMGEMGMRLLRKWDNDKKNK